MTTLRTTALVAHAVCLAVGTFFAVEAVGSVVDNFARDFPELALSRIATAAALVSVTAAYAIALALRGFTPMAPVLFAASYSLLGLLVSGYARAMAKHFAPAPPEDLDGLYTSAIVQIAVVSVVALLCWIWTLRRSRFPLL